ncbi:6-phosphofructokinase [Desulfitobacterium dichloroeliminans LMG P-21439]|uniref:ATP-dependent 6-phosphofructokinase n=1 Tax=Desulfitobacterium dichloroeliminans (strain LMG P-21439 / DCA1) TaxID=871963 RepID=L0F906_DESDL|nr:6-phosphofructokinase [Desulfitobacterium dichloroeliminans]AGA69126.1 6-phosphofructokinase [Desulfitobacterium dichloroeliminans LMG P-21439]
MENLSGEQQKKRKSSAIKKLAILTGGGDCPGLNAVIRAAVKTACYRGIEVVGIQDGFRGAVEGDFRTLGFKDVSGILPRGGTILGTTNRDNPFAYSVQVEGTRQIQDRSDEVMDRFKAEGIDALITIGGDGSLSIAQEFAKKGLNVVGVPKTIDNDLMATDLTFGFQTAVATAQDALDRLHTTAESHHRIMILEVMGRYAGWIALYAGVAGGADVILIPEVPYQLESIAKAVKRRADQGKHFSIIVVAEGAKPLGGEMVVERTVPGRTDPIKLGGIGAKLAADLEKLTAIESRVTVLGHLQRGGSPIAVDRVLSTRYGVAAVEAVLDKDYGMMVALQGQDIVRVPIKEAVHQLKKIKSDDPVLLAARSMGIEFGD